MKTRQPLSLFITLLFVSNALYSQANLKKLDAYFAKALKEWNVPGMAIAIVKDDSLVFAKGYGVREVKKPELVNERTLFAVASNTKAFTSSSMALLVDEKKVEWDQRVQGWLPYFQLYDPYVSADVRIRDLLSHRLGLRTFSGDLIWYGTSYSREEVIRRAKHLKQVFPFRDRYGYSNIMYIAAGEIIEKASGMKWEEFIRTRFLQPLGMNGTILSVRELTGRDNVATPHKNVDSVVVTIPWLDWDNVAPAGSMISNVVDMSLWLRFHLRDAMIDGKRIISQKQKRIMETPHVSHIVSADDDEIVPSTNFRGYGLGWEVYDYHGYKVIQHSGGYDGMISYLAMIPGKKFGVVILTNTISSLARYLLSYTLDAFLGKTGKDWSAIGLKHMMEAKIFQERARRMEDSTRAQGTSPTHPLKDYAGTYGGPMYGNAEVALEEGRLMLRLLPNPEFVADLTHWHFDTFKIQWRRHHAWFDSGKAQFIMNENGKVIEMKLNVPNNDLWFDELEFKRLK